MDIRFSTVSKKSASFEGVDRCVRERVCDALVLAWVRIVIARDRSVTINLTKD
jgi:hypothetical protein